MDYIVRRAHQEDKKTILSLYAQARNFMASRGNPGQWGTNYPTEEQTDYDIASGNLYVLASDGTIHGVFALMSGEDPTYRKIYGGTWHHNLPYGAVHRVAGDGSGGILGAIVSYASERYSYLRIDTHENNFPMRRAVQNQGFLYCGVIIAEDGTPRLAFDRKK